MPKNPLDDPRFAKAEDDASGGKIGLDRHRVDDALYQAFPTDVGHGYVMDQDGLPRPEVPPDSPYAPALSPSTLVCMADATSFCIRDGRGEIVLSFDPREVKRAPYGGYYVELRVAMPRFFDLMPGEFLRVAQAVGLDGRVSVEPVRPACRHYVRQLADVQGSNTSAYSERLCTARKDGDGDFLSLRDAQMFACEMRDPPDPKSIERLDRYDKLKVLQGGSRTDDKAGLDLDAKLDEMFEQQEGGGIFER